MRKPNYEFERAQRTKAKEAKAAAKAQKKQEQRRLESADPAGPDAAVEGGAQAQETPRQEPRD